MWANYRRRVFDALSPSGREGPGLSVANRFLITLIVISVLLAVIESEESVAVPHATLLQGLELFVGAAFLVEYVLRLWTCVEDPRFSHPVMGRVRYALSPPALLDLLAISPVFFSAIGGEAFLLRLVRLVRILRLAKLGRYSVAVSDIARAIHLKRYQLGVSLLGGLILLLISATCLYVLESADQPEAFGSIPRAMWWSIATLTTVGYGDVYPVTVLGRLFASITAVIGIGLIALPAGIVAAAFAEVVVQRREEASEAAISEASASERTLSQLIDEQIERASLQARPHVEVNAGDLHRAALLTNGVSLDLSLLCAQLRASMGQNDIVVHRPAEGDGPALTIRYLLPRRT